MKFYFILEPVVSDLNTIFNKYFYLSEYFIINNWFFEFLPEFILATYILYSLTSLFNDMTGSILQLYRWVFVFFVLLGVLGIKLLMFNSIIAKIAFNFTLLNCFYTLFSKFFIVLLVIVILWISKNKLKNLNQLTCLLEFPVVVGFSVLFMFLLTSSYDFFGVYMSIEGLSLTLYVMAAMLYNGIVSVESAIKYFSLGAISSGILLFGVSILFGLVGSLDFLEVYLFLGNKSLYEPNILELKFSLLCILFGFFFKLSAFPCHIWVADVYEGIWTPITAFFAIVVKIALFLFFIRIVFNVLFRFIFFIQPLLVFVSIGSMFVGTFGALKQVRIKRFIAYTSINQVGFILLGIASVNLSGLIASLMYLILYSVMSLSFFTVLLNSEHFITRRSMIYLSDLQSLSLYNLEISKHLVLVIMSMAGLPPLAGFIGKLFLYFSAMESRLDTAILFSMVISIISTYYYLNLVKHIWFENQKTLKLFYFVSNPVIINLLRFFSVFLMFFVFILPIFLGKVIFASLSCMFPLIWG